MASAVSAAQKGLPLSAIEPTHESLVTVQDSLQRLLKVVSLERMAELSTCEAHFCALEHVTTSKIRASKFTANVERGQEEERPDCTGNACVIASRIDYDKVVPQCSSL